jgi:hypothetical protein
MENQDGLIDIDEGATVSPTGQEPISITETARPVDPKAAERRAKDTHRALGPESPGIDALLVAARNGTDEAIKNSAAVNESIKRQNQRAEAIRELARTTGKAVDQDAIRKLDTIMTMPSGVAPEVVLESKMGESVIDMVTGVSKAVGGILSKAMELNPVQTTQLTEVASEGIARGKIAQRIAEEATSRAKEQSWAGWGIDLLESAIPGRDVYLRNKAFPEANTGIGILPGKTLEDNLKYLHSLPTEEFERQAKGAFEYLADRNIFEAQRFAEALQQYSNSDAQWDNAFSVLNLAGAPPGVGSAKALVKGLLAGRAAKAAAPGATAAAKALSTGVNTAKVIDALKAAGKSALRGETVDEGKVLMDTGHIAEGAQMTARQIIETGADTRTVGGMPAALPSLFNPKAIVQGASSLGREAVDRLVLELKDQSSRIMSTLTDAARVERGTTAAVKVGEAEAFERVKADYRHVEHAILDVKPETRVDPVSNTYETSAFIGKTDGTLFDSAKQAVLTGQDMYGMLKGDLNPVEIGDGKWALKVTRAHDETTEGFRKAMTIDAENATPKGRGWGPMGWLRSAEDLVSSFQSQNRHVAQHGMQRLIGMSQEIAEEIGKLNAESKTFLKNVLEANKSYANLDDDGVMQLGRFNRNVGEFENEFKALNNRMPTAAETKAYFSYIQLNDMDYLVRNFTLYRDKVRQGIQEFQVTTKVGGQKFEGKVVNELPRNVNADAGVYLHTDVAADSLGDYIRLKAFEAEDWNTIDNLLKAGYRIVQVANPSAKPLARLLGEERAIHFVITKDVKTGALPYQQIPYRPGGHKEIVTPHFVKQPVISRMENTKKDVIQTKYEWGESEFNGYKIEYGPTGKSRKDGSPVMATTRHAEKKIVFDKDAVEASWKDKPWRTSKVEGVAPLDDSMFPTPESWARFVLEHEKAHVKFPNNLGEYSPAEYENLINRKAQDAYRKPVNKVVENKSVTHSYEGDTAVFGFNTEAEARKYAQRMEQARILLRDGKTQELSAFLNDNLPYTYGEFVALFKKSTDAALARNNIAQKNIYDTARLSLDEPIVYLPNGRRFTDDYLDLTKGYDNFEDNIRSPYNLYDNIDKEYAGERNPDLYTVREGKGTDNDPLYRIDRAEQLDPFATMTRAMANVMRNRFMDDYKIQAVESFVSEFGDLIKGNRSLDEIKTNPEWYLHNPSWDGSTTDKLRLADAKAAHRSLINFLGTMSPLRAEFDTQLQKMANGIYENFGQKASDKVSGLAIEGDPFRYGRKVAFHLTLGLFNPVQLLLQAQSMVHILGVAGPKAGIQGLAAGTMMNMLRFTDNPNVIAGFGKKAAAFGWKEADFVEAYSALKRSGWNLVEGETAWHDDMLEPKLFNGAGSKFVDKGTFFFKEGEKQVRMSAWATAFQEWKVANNGKALDNRGLAEVLQRADTLSVNMTRASNAAWNQGFMSIPTQFLSYQARLMEQFMGKRLTTTEKLRAFATYSAFYGIPGGVGAAAGVLPWYEDIRKEALERGYDTSDPVVMAMHNGIVQTMWHVATGQDLNFAQRLGPNGTSIFKEALKGEKSVMEMFLGPSGSILSNTIAGLEPVLWSLTSPFRPDDQQYMFSVNDVLQAFQGISSVNNATKVAIAYNTGLWTTKTGTVLKGDVSAFDAVMMGITGASPTEVADAFLMTKSLKSQKQYQDTIQKKVSQTYTRAIKAYADQDPSSGDAYMAQVKMWVAAGGWRPDQMSDVLSRALQGNEGMINRIKEDFVKKAPQNDLKGRMDQFLKSNGQ